ncbi:MAG: hypothetical protein ACI4AO_09715 [Anaerotignum sp.]
MARYTENYDLLLPEEEDIYDVADYNENFEAIDALMAENEETAREINRKLGTPEGEETVFSLLKGNSSIIKSIQRVTYSRPNNTTAGSIGIREVNPEKCIVLFERYYDTANLGAAKLEYALTATAINVTHNSSSTNNSLIVGFWVIEFN